MPQFTVEHDYKASTGGVALAFNAGATVDVDADLADWVNRDSPGTLTPTDPDPEPDPKPDPEPAPKRARKKKTSGGDG